MLEDEDRTLNASFNGNTHSFYPTRPDVFLHLEGLVFLIVGCLAYRHFYADRWGFFALMFLVPDVALIPYIWSKGLASAIVYNVLHGYLLPVGLGLFAWRQGSVIGGQVSLIWLAHISLGRLLGYGLKYPGVFKVTHIQRAA